MLHKCPQWLSMENRILTLVREYVSTILHVLIVSPSAWLPIIIFCVPIMFAGCSSSQPFSKGQRAPRGGWFEDMRDKGEAEGFSTAFAIEREVAYRTTVDNLYRAGRFRGFIPYELMIILSFFSLGYATQWTLFYLLRRLGILLDVNWFFLPKELTSVKFDDRLMSGKDLPCNESPVSTISSLCLLLLCFLSLGCGYRDERARFEGNNPAYRTAYLVGWEAGRISGAIQGQFEGQRIAEEACENGTAWHVYREMAIISVCAGAVGGICLQYGVLMCARRAESLPELPVVAFIPGVKHSLAYQHLENRRKLELLLVEQLDWISVKRDLKLEQLRTVRKVMAHRLSVVSSIQQMSIDRLLALVESEIDKILEESTPKQADLSKHKPSDTSDRLTKRHECPNCSKVFIYTPSKSERGVICPNSACAFRIVLPGLSE